MLPMARALLAVLILYSRNVTAYLFLNKRSPMLLFIILFAILYILDEMCSSGIC